ncbi:hypothetical protein VPH35_037223 [Triticum aestivum]
MKLQRYITFAWSSLKMFFEMLSENVVTFPCCFLLQDCAETILVVVYCYSIRSDLGRRNMVISATVLGSVFPPYLKTCSFLFCMAHLHTSLRGTKFKLCLSCIFACMLV